MAGATTVGSGYGNDSNILDPSMVGPVHLGGPAKAITAGTAGTAHRCAILVYASVECWGYAGNDNPSAVGGLGYGNTYKVADGGPEPATPAAAGAVTVDRAYSGGDDCGRGPYVATGTTVR